VIAYSIILYFAIHAPKATLPSPRPARMMFICHKKNVTIAEVAAPPL
jgi:hypothetical protein